MNKTVKFYDIVMVWSCFPASTIGKFCFIENTENAAHHLQIFKEKFISFSLQTQKYALFNKYKSPQHWIHQKKVHRPQYTSPRKVPK